MLGIVSTTAQNHDNIWLFGYGSQNISTDWGGTVMDFNQFPPAIYYLFNEMDFLQTNASICSADGELQFYTNGLYVANKMHQPMLGGDGLNPGQFADDMDGMGYILDQGAFILPRPDGSNRFSLLHADRQSSTPRVGGHSKHLYYSLVDMGMENGLGKVVQKNKVIIEGMLTAGHLTAVRSGNGRDWWMVVHDMASGNYHRVSITPSGITDMGLGTTSFEIPQEGVGQSVFSPDGSIFARMNAVTFDNGQFIDIYEFDRCTGLLSELVQVQFDDDAVSAGLAISPNSRFLYAPSYNFLYQYDLQAPDIEASKKTIPYDGFMEDGHSLKFFMAQLAPDGKIYINTVNGTHYLHVIHQPNLPYPNCMIQQHGIHLPTYNAFTMPNFPNYRLGPLDGSPCDTLGRNNLPIAKFRYDQDTLDFLDIHFTDLSYYEPSAWSWTFGDGGISNEVNPTHAYAIEGVYEVCLTVDNFYGINTHCDTLYLGTSASGEAQPTANITVFPNPAKEATNIIFSDYLPRHAMLRLFTATGQSALGQQVGFGWNLVPLDALAPGLYFYEITDEGRVLQTGKLVKVE